MEIYLALESQGYVMKAVDYYRLAYAEFHSGEEQSALTHIHQAIELDTEEELTFAGE